MTETVNLLSAGDTAALTRLAMVGSSNVRVLVNALERIGYEAAALLAAAGLRAADLDDPDAQWPCSVYGSIVGTAQGIRPTRNLALHTAAATPLGAFAALDFLVVTSETVGDGLKQLARYFRLLGAPVAVNVHDREDPIRVVVESPFAVFGAEYTIALAVFHTLHETKGSPQGSSVSFTHRPDDPAEFARLFGCPVAVEASWSGLLLPASVWALPLERRNAGLRNALERHAAEVAGRLPDDGDWVAAVRRALAWRVAGGRHAGVDAVAREFGITGRTLQRRLEKVDLAYHELLTEIRRQVAEEHLTDSRLAIGEIGFLLGYSDRAAFHRAFKRWTGLTPQAFRKRQQQAKGGG